jgi:hypothetical protein
MSGLVLIFFVVLAGPIWVFGLEFSALHMKEWQTWFGALLGFGGLIAIAAYNGAAERSREQERYDRKNNALALAIAWEVFAVAHRARWSAQKLDERLKEMRSDAEKVGQKEEDLTNVRFRVLGGHMLFAYVPQPDTLQNLTLEVGHLGNTALDVSSFVSFVVQSSRSIQTAFEVYAEGNLGFQNLVAAHGWLNGVYEEGIELMGKLADSFEPINERLQVFLKEVEEPEPTIPTLPSDLVYDTSAWTGLSN